MTVRRLTPGDENIASEIAATFKNAVPSGEHLRGFLADSAIYLFAAAVEGKPVGFALGYRLPRLDGESAMMMLYEIEVLEAFRRQGIGRKLIEALLGYSQQEGHLKAFVITEESNLAAMRLYQSVGGIRTLSDEAVFIFRGK